MSLKQTERTVADDFSSIKSMMRWEIQVHKRQRVHSQNLTAKLNTIDTNDIKMTADIHDSWYPNYNGIRTLRKEMDIISRTTMWAICWWTGKRLKPDVIPLMLI